MLRRDWDWDRGVGVLLLLSKYGKLSLLKWLLFPFWIYSSDCVEVLMLLTVVDCSLEIFVLLFVFVFVLEFVLLGGWILLLPIFELLLPFTLVEFVLFELIDGPSLVPAKLFKSVVALVDVDSQ